MTIGHVDFEVSAENTGTETLRADLAVSSRQANVTIDIGNFVGTITAQRRFTKSTAISPPTPFIDIKQYSANIDVNESLTEIESGVEHRLFVKTGDYTSGTAYIRLSF